MSKSLHEMSNEELWRLFPIELRAHDPAWAGEYERMAQRLWAVLGQERMARCHHIGSTAVPGLLAKPIVDILVELRAGADAAQLPALLEPEGFLYSPQPDKPPPHSMFLRGYTPQGFRGQAFHVHIRYIGDWDELYFRDWLRAHPGAAREYEQLKRSLAQRYRNDRDAYTRAKGDFVAHCTRQARQAAGGSPQ